MGLGCYSLVKSYKPSMKVTLKTKDIVTSACAMPQTALLIFGEEAIAESQNLIYD